MRRSKSEHEGKTSRRRSWFNGFSTIFNSSAPPSPDRKSMIMELPLTLEPLPLTRHRSQSLTPVEVISTPPPTRSTTTSAAPTTRPKAVKSTFSSIISKATKKNHHKRKESSNLTLQEDTSSIFDHTSLRRGSSKSDATTISDMDTVGNNKYKEPSIFQKVQQKQLLKSDEEEADRIQLKNDLVKLAFEGEFSLPFDYKDLPSARILDVGCGPGSWCIDLSQKYPRIEVIGVDSDDMFPSQHNLPSNCQLLVCNVLNGLKEFPDASFDVIHIRFMVLSFTTAQYPRVVKDCWRLLKPGGYIEILETDLTVYSPGPMTKRLNEEMLEVALSRGLDPRTQANTLSQLIPADGINGQVKYRSIPIGVWGGRIGVLCRDDMINMLTKFQPAVYDYFGKSDQDFKHFNNEITTVMREMEQYKSFSNYYFYTAQKPEVNTPPPQAQTQQQQYGSPCIIKRNYTTGSFNPKSF